MLDTDVIEFLLKSHRVITTEPICGCLYTTYTLFKSKYSRNQMEYNDFKDQLNTIGKIDKHAFQFTNDNEEINFINTINLEILLNKLKPSNSKVIGLTKQSKVRSSPVDQLQDLLSHEESSDLKTLISLLNYRSTGFQLSKEKLQHTTPKYPFIEVCNDPRHQQASFKSDPCFKTKIHFIPIIHAQTDTSLGDCSYLDTCHKMDTCRYVHYSKYIPKSHLQLVEKQCNEFNSNIIGNEKMSYWNINGSAATTSRSILPSQWINCDVRKFDFKILGKFAAVIADPAWNIHMNLPYGTCNDTELNALPLSSIQEEGIICLWVTGRTIEIGKKALINWGYKISNEVIWIKTNQLGRTICTGRTGHWLNHSKEHLIIGIKGNPKWLRKNLETDIIVSGTRETSRKPDELYEMVERLVGPHARKLEIFGRDHNTRPGWFTIGNQLKGNNIVEHDVLQRYNESTLKR